jgi:hypothetical protein
MKVDFQSFTTLCGENAVNFLCTSKLRVKRLHPQKFGCTSKNEGKRVHVPPDEKTCGHAAFIGYAQSKD